MPIRLRDATAFAGRLRGVLSDATCAFEGAHTAPPARSGTIQSRLDEFTPAIFGQFQAAPNRTGLIAATLGDHTASETGTAAPPAIPDLTGAISASLQGVTAALSGSLSAAGTAPGWFPNHPVMLAQCVQAARSGGLDPLMAADVNLLIVTSFLPTSTRMQAECDAIDNIRAQQDSSKMQTRVLQYLTPNVTAKTLTTYNDGERLFSLQLILDPVNGSPLVSGSPTWKVHRVNQPGDEGLCESQFQPLNDHQVNITAGAGLNSLGEDYATAYWKKYNNTWTAAYKSRLSGFFHDVFTQVPAPLRQNNGQTIVTDPDYNGDGVADIRTNFGTSGGNGGRQWSLGGLNTIAKYKARFGDKPVVTNTANLPGDYNSGVGPLPINTAPLYRQLDFPFQESVELFLSLHATGTGWTVAGTPGATGRLAAFYEAYYVQESMARTESDMGTQVRGAVLMHSNCNNREPTSADLEAMRFMSLACLLVERAAPCISAGSGIVWTLDELLLELGTPVGTRSMGSFNLSNAVLTLRAPDFTNGIAKFFWARFSKGIVVIRGDTPTTGAYPSNDVAISCTLPPPGSGKKWQRVNAATYVNPITGRAMRNQAPTLNNGADATTISLKPLHAMALRLVST